MSNENQDAKEATVNKAVPTANCITPTAKGRVITGLATLPDKTLLDETALAEALGTCKRTVRRMVARYELPPAVRFGGKSTWQAGAVLRWFEARADRAARQAEKSAQKMGA